MTEKKIRSLAYAHVERNWIVLWQHLNAGGLVQHQRELTEILTFFALKTQPKRKRKKTT